jgi:hypothetical protein
MLKMAKRREREERLEKSIVEDLPARPTIPGSSPRTPATSRDPSIKREDGFQLVDPTDNLIKGEPAIPGMELNNTHLKREGSALPDESTQTTVPLKR